MFEEISEKLSEITKEVTDSTQQQIDVMKMRSSIKKEEAAIENAYKELGKIFFKQNVSVMPEEYVEYIDAVREAKVKITECKEKIVQMRGMQLCVECNQEIKNSMNFCPNCGAKISEL